MHVRTAESGEGFRVLGEAMARRKVSARARRRTEAMAADPLLSGRRGAQESARVFDGTKISLICENWKIYE